MFFDQAFMGFPNFYLSNPEYNEEYEYEASITQAFALSLFQELNARNIQNPHHYIRQEIRYKKASKKIKGFHADFRMNLSAHEKIHGENIVTEDLEKYGFCKDNWLEVKYFRKGQNPTINRRKLQEDILRLMLLSPLENSVGRYFLHVYVTHPTNFIADEKVGAPLKVATDSDSDIEPESTWYEKLQSPGRKRIEFGPIDHKSTDFSSEIAKLKISKLWVYNNIIKPRKRDEVPYFLLTRIDHFEIEYDGASIKYEYGKISGEIHEFGKNLENLFKDKNPRGRPKQSASSKAAKSPTKKGK